MAPFIAPSLTTPLRTQAQPPTSKWRLARKHFIPAEMLEIDRAASLGKGAFGCVFKGTLHRMPVAVKTCALPSAEAGAEVLRMFRREAQVCTRVVVAVALCWWLDRLLPCARVVGCCV